MTIPPADIFRDLEQLKSDPDSSKKMREKVEQVFFILQEDSELAIDKALLCLEELERPEMSSPCRMLVWDLVSKLESLRNGNVGLEIGH